MHQTRFNLIFDGKVEPGYDRDTVWQTLQLLFKFDTEDPARLFSGEPIVLGESMDAETADTFQRALAGAGATTHLVAANGAVTTEAKKEQRSGQRRVSSMRRARLRTGAIVPDRRQNRDRRR